MTHSMCTNLLEELKTYDTILAAPLGGPSRPTGNAGPLAAMLDHAMEEIFVPWLEGTRYLESESKNLVELYAGLLSRFTRYHVSSNSPPLYLSLRIGNCVESQTKLPAGQGRFPAFVIFNSNDNVDCSSCRSCYLKIRSRLHLFCTQIHSITCGRAESYTLAYDTEQISFTAISHARKRSSVTCASIWCHDTCWW